MVLTFESVDEVLGVAFQIKPLWHYFYLVLFILSGFYKTEV